MASPKNSGGGASDEIDLSEMFKQVMKDPKLAEQVRKQAQNYHDDVLSTWPTDNRTTADTGGFKNDNPGKAFVIIDTESEDGRPVSIVQVRHPYAVAHQARTGAFTKAAGKNFNERW